MLLLWQVHRLAFQHANPAAGLGAARWGETLCHVVPAPGRQTRLEAGGQQRTPWPPGQPLELGEGFPK